MSSSDKNKSSGDDRDETSREPDSSAPQDSGSARANSSESRQEAADKRAPESADDDDFIPKLSQVRSRHLQDGEEEGNPEAEETGLEVNWGTERAQTQQHFDPSLETYLIRPADAEEKNEPVDASNRTSPDLSAAVLAIEMAAVTSFDHLPVTTVRPSNVDAQSFPARSASEPEPSQDAEEHRSPEFGYHKEVTEKDAPQQESNEMPFMVEPSALAQATAHEQRSEAAPAPHIVDSLISQSGALDELWASLDGEKQTDSEPIPPTAVAHSVETKSASTSSMPDEIGHANALVQEQRAALANAVPSQQDTKSAYSTPAALSVESFQERQARAKLVRRSLYWVVQEARLVTHGVFADFEPRSEESYATDATAITGDHAPTHSVAQGRDAAPPAVAHNRGSQVDQWQQPAVVSQLDAYPQSGPSAPVPSPVQQKTRPTQHLVGPGADDESGDEAPTVLTSGSTHVGEQDKHAASYLKPELTDGPIKPDIAISHRPGALTPVSADGSNAVDQRVTDQRMRDQRTTAQRAKDQQNVTLDRAKDQRITSERTKDQQITDQRTTDQRTTSDGKIKLPLLGFVNKEKLKKGAVTVGSVFILCVACVAVMYDSLNANRNTESKPGPELQKPDDSESTDKDPGSESTKSSTSPKPNKEKDELKLAFKLEQDQQYTAALEQFDSIIAGKGKDNPKALHGRGRVLTKLQRYESALEDLESASEKDPKNELVLIDLAAAKYLSNDYSGAAMEYERIISAHPDDVDALYGRGISYAGMLKSKEAIADFENVVKLKPGYDKAYRQMCTTYLAMGQPDKAEAAITVAMKACGTDADLYFSRGLSRYQMGRKENSLQDYNEAIKLSPKRKEYYNDRGYVFMDLGRIDEARKDFQKALEIDPRYKLAVDNLRRLRKLEKSEK